MKPLPDNILSKMNPDERKRLGKLGRSTVEIIEANQIKSEKELQQQCVAMLRLKNVMVLTPAFGRKTTICPGWPDLTFALRGKACAWECKLPGNKPTSDQSRVMLHMAENGWNICLIHSVEEMREALKELEKV